MADFKFSLLVNDPMADIKSAGLVSDTGAAAQFTMDDIGKLVVLKPGHAYGLAKAGEHFDGFVVALSPTSVNEGISFGSVQKSGRFYGVTSAEGMIGGYVKAGPQTAAGVAMVDHLGTIGKLPVVTPAADAATTGVWRIISSEHSHQETVVIPVGSKVLVERV